MSEAAQTPVSPSAEYATTAGSRVTPGQVGEIETTIELNTEGLDEAAIQRLRDMAYSDERHSRILDSVLRGAISGYGLENSLSPFVQWIWCQWLDYLIVVVPAVAEEAESPGSTKEAFKKRYRVVPAPTR
jgi:hypothetical protein